MSPAEVFDWEGLALSGLAAFIGAAAAFIFAIWLWRMQRAEEHRRALLTRRATDLLALRSTISICMQNLEETLNFKQQVGVAMTAEGRLLQQLLDGQPSVPKLLQGIQSHETYFKIFDPVAFAELPKVDQFLFLADDLPYIISFLHRAAKSQEALNGFMRLRNALADEWSRKAKPDLEVREVAYLMTMLISHSGALAEAIEDALFFHLLLSDQCYFVGLEKFVRPTFPYFTFGTAHAALLPPDDWVRSYRERMVTYGRPLPPRVKVTPTAPLDPAAPAGL